MPVRQASPGLVCQLILRFRGLQSGQHVLAVLECVEHEVLPRPRPAKHHLHLYSCRQEEFHPDENFTSFNSNF